MRWMAACSGVLMVVVSALGALAATADTVTLSNGDRVTGKVELVDAGAVVIKTDWGGRLTIKRASVTSLDTDEARIVRLQDGAELAGPLAAAAPDALVVGDTRVAMADVHSVYTRSTGLVPRVSGWKTRADAAASVSSGNSEARNFSVGVNSQLHQQTLRHTGNFKLQREEDDGSTTKDQLTVNYGLDWFFGESWFANFDSQYFQDPLRDIDSRINLGAGVGRQFWDTSQGALSAELGASAVFEDIDGRSETNPALRWALDFNRFLWGKRLEAFHQHTILVLADTDRGQLFDSTTGLRMALADRLSATAQLEFDYETEPSDGRDKEDITWSLGVSYQFGR